MKECLTLINFSNEYTFVSRRLETKTIVFSNEQTNHINASAFSSSMNSNSVDDTTSISALNPLDPVIFFPSQIILEILHWLPPKHLLKTALVSKQWLPPSLKIFYRSVFFSNRLKFDRFMMLFTSSTFYAYPTLVEALSLTATPLHFKLVPSVLQQIYTALPNLISLKLSFLPHNQISPLPFHRLPQHTLHLECLHLTNYLPSSDDTLYTLFKSTAVQLKEVRLISCKVQGTTIRALLRNSTSLHSFSILGTTVSEKTFQTALSPRLTLETLEIGNFTSTISFAMLESSGGQNLKKLSLFSIQDIPTVDSDTLDHILSNLPSLRSLAISDASNLRASTITSLTSRLEKGSSSLRSLYLGKVKGADVIAALARLRRWGELMGRRDDVDISDIEHAGSVWWELETK